MSLEEQVMTEMKDAMKSRNEGVLRALRAIKAEIIKAKTDPGSNGEIDETTCMVLEMDAQSDHFLHPFCICAQQPT